MPRKTSDLDKHIGLRLKMRRILLNLTQDDLAQKLNITFQQVQKYEKSTNRISAVRLYQIANILNIDINYFFEGYFPSEANIIQEKTINIFSNTEILNNKNNLTQKNIITSLIQMPYGDTKNRIFNVLKEHLMAVDA